MIALAVLLLAVPQDAAPVRISWAPPGTIDPSLAAPGAESRVVLALFEGLTTLAPDGTTVRPGVAERWEPDAERRTWTFHLRESAWSDGQAVTAAHFVSAWRRALRLGGPQVLQFRSLRGVGAWLDRGPERPDPDEAALGFAAAGPRTLRVEAEAPAPWLPHLLAGAAFVPLPPQALRGGEWTRAGAVVTNGPYLLDGASIAELRLRKNPRNADPVLEDAPGFVSLALHSPAVALERYRAGVLLLLGPEQIDDEAAAGLPGRVDMDLQGTVVLRLNPARAPFDRPGFRRAMAQGIDREALVKGTPARPRRTLAPPGLAGAEGIAPDRAAAMEGLLKETGFDLSKAPPVVLLVPDLPRMTALAGRLRTDLEKGLGLAVKVDLMKAPAYARALAAGDYAAALGGLAGDGLDPAPFRAEERGLAEALVVPLCGTWETHAAAPGLEGLVPNPFGHVSLRHLRRR